MIFMEDNIFDLKEKVSLLNKELNKKDIQINEQDKLYKEIERLNNELVDLQNRFDNLMEAHKICDEDNDRLNNIIDTILNFGFFKEECPLNFGFSDKMEDKAQDIFYEDEEWCEQNCNDEYKKCWIKYFDYLNKLKEGKE